MDINSENSEKKNLVGNTTNSENKQKNDTNVPTVDETKKENEESSTNTTVKEDSTDAKDSKSNGNDLKLSYLNKDFIYDIMSVPTCSKEEYRMVTYVIMWARKNNVKYEFDKKGNIYLTKGELAEGEYYPCVTSHLDTVQNKQKLYAQGGCRLTVKTRINAKQQHEIYVDGMGIGGDDKAGVAISLSLFSHVDKLKACFFLEEEIGCLGSKELNADWFNNVGYVLGFDSPDLNRAAWSCSGVKLFSKEFFQTYLEEVCKNNGLTKFYAEPFTDVKTIREKTEVICANFGTGYYNAHTEYEYCVLEEMDSVCKMGKELIEKIGRTRHTLPVNKTTFVKCADNSYKRTIDEDETFFNKRNGYSSSYGSYGGSYYNNHSSYYDNDDDYYYGGNYSNYQKTNTNLAASTNKNENSGVKVENVRYITERYESHINTIKSNLKAKCEELNIDFNLLESVFETNIKF